MVIFLLCTSNFTTGWKDKTSVQFSTKINNANTWSYISGKEIDVKPNERYEVVTHMKLNKFVRQSQIVIEGFNEIAKEWTEIMPFCPRLRLMDLLSGMRFTCEITIPEGIIQIRPILYAGFSSQKDKQACDSV